MFEGSLSAVFLLGFRQNHVKFDKNFLILERMVTKEGRRKRKRMRKRMRMRKRKKMRMRKRKRMRMRKKKKRKETKRKRMRMRKKVKEKKLSCQDRTNSLQNTRPIFSRVPAPTFQHPSSSLRLSPCTFDIQQYHKNTERTQHLVLLLEHGYNSVKFYRKALILQRKRKRKRKKRKRKRKKKKGKRKKEWKKKETKKKRRK